MIVIVSDDKKENIGKSIYDYLKKRDIEVSFISASEGDIKPCYGCNGCVDKTYGKCIFRDDMDKILPILLEGDILIFTSPLVWGGLSYDVKKILDKTALIGDRFYNVNNKELVKGSISKNKKTVGIAVSDQLSAKEESDFKYFIKELGIITNVDYIGKVVGTSITETELESLIKEVLA